MHSPASGRGPREGGGGEWGEEGKGEGREGEEGEREGRERVCDESS